VNKIFEKPWFGVITSSLSSMIVFQSIPFVAPFVDTSIPETTLIIIAFLAGCFFQSSQFFYFRALIYSDAGIVSAYWNFTPAFLPLASYIIFRQAFNLHQYIGIIIQIFASVGLCLVDSNLRTRWIALFFMLGGSMLQVIGYMMEDYVFDRAPFFPAYLIFTAGLITTGFVPLFWHTYRQQVLRNFRTLISFLRIFLLIEIVNLVAIALGQFALTSSSAPLVAAISSTIPMHIFLINLFLLRFVPKLVKRESPHKLPYKFGLVTCMVFGVWLLS